MNRSKTLVALIAFAIILSNLAVAASNPPPPTVGCSTASAAQAAAWYSDLPIAIIVLLVAFLIAAIIFMVGTALKNDRMRNFGIGELYEALASAIIVALFLYIGAAVVNAANVVPGVSCSSTPYATASSAITSTIGAAETMYFGTLTAYETEAAALSTVTTFEVPYLDYYSQSSAFTATQLPIFIATVAPEVTLASFLADGIFVLWVEYYLLFFFSIAAIPVFVAPGVIFRALFPTRGFGGMMIALGIGFYIIMPVLFAFAFTNFGTLNSSNVYSQFWLLMLFYPALIIAVTYAFVSTIANFIGGSSQMGGRIRGLI